MATAELRSSLPLRGTKRKAAANQTQVIKKARYTPSSAETSPDSSETDDFDEDKESKEASGTPLSPVSAKPSPNWPSLLKTKKCPYEGCDKSFNRPVRLEEHIRSHTNTRIYVCPEDGCGKDFLRQTHLNHHIKSAHSSVREYVCKYKGCGKSFVTNTRLKRHHAAHEGREKHMCQDCCQTFRKHATLNRHVLTVHEGKAAFVCEEELGNGKICGEGFETAGKLKSHRGREHGSEQYRCTICEHDLPGSKDSRFATYTDLQAHNRSVHPPTCLTCGLACGSARELRRHAEVEHGLDPGPTDQKQAVHICPEPSCRKAFSKKGNLTVHLKSVHSNEKRFVCGQIDLSNLNNVHGWDGIDACGRGFTAKASLEEHVRTAHLGMDHCRKAERQRKAAGKNTHNPEPSLIGLLTGTGYIEDQRRNIPCLVRGCSFMFTRKYDRDGHLRAKHGLGDLEVHRLVATAETGVEDTDMDFEASAPLVRDHDHWDDMLNQSVEPEGQFWLGGSDPPNRISEWNADIEQMYTLIDDDDEEDDEDAFAIDPQLR